MSINTYAFLDCKIEDSDIFEWIIEKMRFLEIDHSKVDGLKTESWIKHPKGKTIWMNIEKLPSSNVYSSHFTGLDSSPWIVSLDSSAGRKEIDLVLMYFVPWLLIRHSHGLGAIDPQLGSELINQEEAWLRIAARSITVVGDIFWSIFEKSKGMVV
jgi:hypothetical protein